MEAKAFVVPRRSRGSAYEQWVLAVKGGFAAVCTATNCNGVDHWTLSQGTCDDVRNLQRARGVLQLITDVGGCVFGENGDAPFFGWKTRAKNERQGRQTRIKDS